MEPQKQILQRYWWALLIPFVIIVYFVIQKNADDNNANNPAQSNGNYTVGNPQGTNSQQQATNDNAPPPWPSTDAQYITAVPLDLSQIERISKFRSCAGHDFSGSGFDHVVETNRSMKHYAYPVSQFQGTVDAVKLYAPFDGEVTRVVMDDSTPGKRPRTGNAIAFGTPIDPNVEFEFSHLYFTEDFKIGDPVTAGQLVGHAALGEPGFDFDLVLTGKKDVTNQSVFGSFFDHMNDTVRTSFAEYGIAPEEMSFSKAYRDADPCNFENPDSAHTGRDNEDWVVLTQ